MMSATKVDNPVKVDTWGNVNGRILGQKTIVADSTFLVTKTISFWFPKEDAEPLPIYGVKHLDYNAHPSKAKFSKGAFGDTGVSVEVKSKMSHGIESTFIFYTD